MPTKRRKSLMQSQRIYYMPTQASGMASGTRPTVTSAATAASHVSGNPYSITAGRRNCSPSGATTR